MIFPIEPILPLVHITTYSQESLGSYGGLPNGALGNPLGSGNNWPTTDEAIFIPFVVRLPITVQKMFYASSAISPVGNVDLGIYDTQGNKIVSTGSTANNVATAINTISISSTILEAGVYYMAMAMSTSGSGTGIASGATNALSGNYERFLGIAQMDNAFPLPTTATFAIMTYDIIPFIGVSMRSFI